MVLFHFGQESLCLRPHFIGIEFLHIHYLIIERISDSNGFFVVIVPYQVPVYAGKYVYLELGLIVLGGDLD